MADLSLLVRRFVRTSDVDGLNVRLGALKPLGGTCD